MSLFFALLLAVNAAADPAADLYRELQSTFQPQKRLAKLQRLRDSFPSTAYAVYAEAWLHLLDGRNAEAETAFTRALAMQPVLYEAYCGRSSARGNLQRYEGMAEDARLAFNAQVACGYSRLGYAYLTGRGVPADPQRAMTLFQQAAQLNDAWGAYYAGWMYDNGKGVAMDPKAALPFYQKAADLELPSAQGALGLMYNNARGTPTDLDKAIALYKKAAEAGDSDGMYFLAQRYHHGGGVPKDRRKAFELFHKSAEMGNSGSKFFLERDFADLLAQKPLSQRPVAPRPAASQPVAASKPAIPKPAAPANLSLKVAFAEPSGNDMLDGEETGSLRLTVANAGPGAAYSIALTASFEATPGLAAPAAVTIEKLDAGASAERLLELRASDALPRKKLSLKVEAKEANGFDADPVIVELETRPFRAPRLELSDIAVGGTGLVKAGEVTKVTLTIKNTGEGPAAGVKAALNPGTSEVFISGDPEAALGALEPGQSRAASFEFFVNKRFSGKSLPVGVTVTEERRRYGLSKPLGLALGEGAPAVQIVAVKGRETAPAAVAVEPEVENVDAPPATSAAPNPDAYAVVIGVEKYRQGLPEVEYAARDAQTVHAYLTKSMGFDPRNVALLQNELANKTDFEKYLGTWLKNRVTPKSRVLVFYAGHGAPGLKSGESYLVPHDGDPAYAEDTAFPLKRLYENLAALPTKDVTVVLDACFSGAGGRSVIAKGARPLVTKVDTAGGAGANTVVLAATAGDQISTHYPEGRHGLLTYFLLKGLRGAADSDKDGAITTAELYDFVKPSVEREARLRNVEQSPSLIGDDARRVWLRTR